MIGHKISNGNARTFSFSPLIQEPHLHNEQMNNDIQI